MYVTVLFFAGQRDITGSTSLVVQLAPPACVGDLWQELVRRHPRLAPFGASMLFAVDHEFATRETPILVASSWRAARDGSGTCSKKASSVLRWSGVTFQRGEESGARCLWELLGQLLPCTLRSSAASSSPPPWSSSDVVCEQSDSMA